MGRLALARGVRRTVLEGKNRESWEMTTASRSGWTPPDRRAGFMQIMQQYALRRDTGLSRLSNSRALSAHVQHDVWMDGRMDGIRVESGKADRRNS